MAAGTGPAGPFFGRRHKTARYRLAPGVLNLEDRRLLSAFHVNSTADDGSVGTLRWAVQQADVATSPSTIDFNLGNTPQTITLSRGELDLSNTAESITIDGPGARLLSVSGNNAGRVFRIDPAVTATISGLTVTGGAAGDHGGGVYIEGSATLTGCVITGSSAQYGGGLFNHGTAKFIDCSVSGNTATFEGAGIYNDGSLTLEQSSISANTSHELGGGLQNKGTATLNGSTIISNTSQDGGGGVYNSRTVTLTNCTISGNTGSQGGGLTNYATATLTNCTIGFNSAASGGGGLSNSGNGPGNQTTLTLLACTITGNTAATGGGIFNHMGLVNPAVATLTDTIVAGNMDHSADPNDIGGQQSASVTGTFSLVGTGGSGAIEGGVQGNIVLTNLANLRLGLLRDFGGPTQSIALMPGSAAIGTGTAMAGITTDERGFALDAPSPDIGAFQTGNLPLVVGAVTDNGASPGVLDLRGAIDLAEIRGGAQIVTFDPTIFDTAQTITLTGQIKLSGTSGPITIDGPGANLVSINGNHADRVFQINPETTATLSGLTITGGLTSGEGGGVLTLGTARLADVTIDGNSAGYGGGLLSDGTLVLDNCTISGNHAAIEGGGVWVDGTATISGSAITGNTSADIGGGVNISSGTLTMTASTVSGNSSQQGGGGVYNRGTATITGCTISGNSAKNGGGLDTGVNALSTLTNSTLSGNTAQHGAGLESYSRTMLTDCTISGNNASASGGGVSNSGTVTLLSCTVSGNSAPVSGGGLYNHDFIDQRGAVTLTDTIVAGNTGAGGASSDVGGIESGRVTGSFSLIGPGGAGGIQGGAQGNIVLANLAGLGLAPLGNYGGPTQTVALLPGSPALGFATSINGIAFDQRGEALDVPADIGAYQSQGFVFKAAPGTTPQSAPTGEAFANPLVVTVTARNPVEPVAGGTVTYTVNPDDGGAGANLSANTAVIGADGRAQVTATANDVAGTYTVTVTSTGGQALPGITLANLPNNLIALTFSGLDDQSVSFGTATVTFTGTLAHGAQMPPAGETVAVTLGGVTHQVVIGAGGGFTTTFAAAALAVPGSPFTVRYRYTSDGTFASAATSSLLNVTKATPTVVVTDLGGTTNATGGSAVFGQQVTFVATVTGPGGPSGSITFFDGTTLLANVWLDAAGRATLPESLPVGSHAITAFYSGDLNLLGKTSGTFTESVAQAGTQLKLMRQPMFRKKNVVSVRLSAELDPLAPGQGIASGAVKFMIKKKTLATVALDGGTASATFKVNSVLNKKVTVVYSGDRNFKPSQAVTPVLSRAALKSVVQSVIAAVERLSPFSARGPFGPRP
jgi:hypothetical protein